MKVLFTGGAGYIGSAAKFRSLDSFSVVQHTSDLRARTEQAM
jgi:UDP-glucose 4-epimerase